MPDSHVPDHINDAPPAASEDDYGAVPMRDHKPTPYGFRAPPSNFEAEKALLGALMANNKAYEKVLFLRPEHFADPIHSDVFSAMVKQIEAGRISNPITLKDFFEKNETLADIGGNKYLVELAASCVTIINAAEYGRIIYDLYLKRELIHLGTEMVNNAHSGEVEETAEKQREWAEGKLFELAAKNDAKKARGQQEIIQSAMVEIDKAYKNKGAVDGLKTCLTAIDRILGGIPESSLVILAGRPGMGKTALAIAMAYHGAVLSDDPQPAAFFSLEMGGEQIVKRLISDISNVPHSMLRSGEYHDQEQFEETIGAAQKLMNAPLYIDDSAGLSVSDIKARLRNMMRNHKVKICYIDYLTHIRPRDPKMPKVYQVEQITRDLKAMSKEFGVPVVLLCQLSRAVEQREDKRPMLSDLRDSGAIEQDADQVLFAYRKSYYLEREEPVRKSGEDMDKYLDRVQRYDSDLEACRRSCEVIIAKNRHGGLGSPTVFFDPVYQRVRDMAQIQEGMF